MNAADLVEIEAIKQLKARYFRCMDEKRWDDWGQVFTEDATLDTREDAKDGFHEGRNRIQAFVSAAVAEMITVHHGHMPEIEMTGERTARGVWAMEDYLELKSDASYTIHGRGHYHEEYEKGDDGAWRIKSLKLTRLWVRHQGAPPQGIVDSGGHGG
ncbi:nuclear transport factor 2 family protein [Myxococcota bacterium]|nr:nuclear transport factor 2 family protein [Myxococcota bacterium]